MRRSGDSIDFARPWIRSRTTGRRYQLAFWWMEDEVRSSLDSTLSRPISNSFFRRVALARAMLMKVDLLLLDEPTNHLDRNSVEWLQSCEFSSTFRATSILTLPTRRPLRSDPNHLDDRLARLWIPRCRLHQHRPLPKEATRLLPRKSRQVSSPLPRTLPLMTDDSLRRFVEKNPAGKSYYTLSASLIKFTFPPPGSLMGVRSQTRAILKMTGCTFTYPGQTKPQLNNVSAAVSLSSRVGIGEFSFSLTFLYSSLTASASCSRT